MNEIKVNDGKGFYDNVGLCDTLINDCNNAVKQLASGQYILFCGVIHTIAQKLINLKKGIAEDIDNRDKMIEDLRAMNNDLAKRLAELTAEREGVK